MEKLIIDRKDDFYRLEVNDNGDCIEFDLTDINLPRKILIASQNISKIDKKYKEETNKINKENTEIETIEKLYNLEIDTCLELRKEFDSFLGEGACQKIFGDTNNYFNFIRLMDALEPHYEKMNIKMESLKKKLVNKYMPSDDDIL